MPPVKESFEERMATAVVAAIKQAVDPPASAHRCAGGSSRTEIRGRLRAGHRLSRRVARDPIGQLVVGAARHARRARQRAVGVEAGRQERSLT
jgi:hypothetical protein